MNLDAYMSHPLWAAIDAALDSIDVSDASPERAEPLTRVRVVLSSVKGFKTAAHAAILSTTMLDGAHSHLSNVTSYLGNHPSNFEQYLDQLLTYVAPWSVLLPPAKQAEQARAGSAAMAQGMLKQVESFKKREAEIRADSEVVVAKLQAATERLATLEATISQTAAEQQKSFAAAEETRLAEHKAALKEADEAVSKSADRSLQTANERVSEIEAELEKARKHLVDVENLVGRVGSAHIAGDHGKYAKREFVAAWWAYAIGVAALASGAVVILMGMEDLRTDTEPKWAWLAAKLSFGALVGAVATVAFRLGGRFLSSSNQAKRLELELLSLEPFLANVDDDKAQTAKLAFMERTFGREPDQTPPKDGEDPSIPLSTYQGVAEAIIGVVKKTP